MYRKLTPTSKTVNGQPLYSPELSFGNMVYVSGKGPGTGFKGDITAQTKNVLDQIEESLKLAGSSMEKVLKVNVYLTDMNNFAGMNEAYINRFGPNPPVRTTVAVVAIPDGTLVEMTAWRTSDRPDQMRFTMPASVARVFRTRTSTATIAAIGIRLAATRIGSNE